MSDPLPACLRPIQDDDDLKPTSTPLIARIPGTIVVNPYKKRPRDVIDHGSDPSKKSRATESSENVIVSQRDSEDASKVTRLLRKKTKWVFAEFLYRCMVCGSTSCNGEMCLQGCYRCGNRSHKTNACPFTKSKLNKILENKGVCFGCYDTRQHTMEKHDILQCPLKRRLKRLLFLDHDRIGGDFEMYLRKVYASGLTFVETVAAYSKDTLLGR